MTQNPSTELQTEIVNPTYGVSTEFVAEVVQVLEAHNKVALNELIADLHAADVADLINRLDETSRRAFVDETKRYIDPDVLANLEDRVKDQVLEWVGPGAIAAAIADLESDDAVHVLEDMDTSQLREVLRAIPARNRALLEEVLTYPEESAGRLMQREIVCVPTFWTIQETLDFVRESSDLPDVFYNIYVVDPKHTPIGVMSLDTLLRHPHSTPISEVIDTNINSVPVEMDREEVANIFKHYGLLSAPVVDPSGRIVGMITVDDIVDVIEEEAEEDIMHLGGVAESDFNSPIFTTAYSRARWLFITIVNTLIAAAVISIFEASIAEKVALSFLMVIVAAVGGNAGMQTVTVIVRALATKELDDSNQKKALRKELAVSLLTGVTFATFLGSIAGFWLQDAYMGLVLGVALVFNTLWSGAAGTLLPIFVQKMGMDPAISAGPLLSTTTDVLGYAIFLGLATYFLL